MLPQEEDSSDTTTWLFCSLFLSFCTRDFEFYSARSLQTNSTRSPYRNYYVRNFAFGKYWSIIFFLLFNIFMYIFSYVTEYWGYFVISIFSCIVPQFLLVLLLFILSVAVPSSLLFGVYVIRSSICLGIRVHVTPLHNACKVHLAYCINYPSFDTF